ncbi:TfuA-like protein [Streptomyces olivaceus]
MIHVFVGPTLPGPPAQLAAPGIRVRPPAGHGDLFDPAIRRGDTVLLLDGVFHQAPALRHKEILAAMDRAVTVMGAASIGALRAAELAPLGMIGVGRIYDGYTRGEIVGDDEVAVGQAPDGSFDALTCPLVNLRHLLRLARSAGVIEDERASRLLAAWHAVYYPQRTWSAVRAVCRRRGEDKFARWLAERLDEDRYFGDLKRADALAAVRAALDDPAPTRIRSAPPGWQTGYFRDWSNAFARQRVDGLELATEDRLVYQQVFDPAFRARWADYLEHRSRHPAGTGPGLPLAERLGRVTGGGLSADQVFHPPVDLRDETSVALLLAGESTQDRRAVARYAQVLAAERRARPAFTVAAIDDGLTRRLLSSVWRCPADGFDAEASARGLTHGPRAVAAAKRLVPGLLEEIRETGGRRETASGTR